MAAGDVLVSVRAVTKDYHGLRPLRIASLDVREGEIVALLGFDQVTAELLVNLVTGAVLPDAGEVTIFGARTSAVTSSDEWLSSLDRFGILSDRAVLLDQLTAEQNLAMPFSLDIDELSDELRGRVRALGEEVGLPAADLGQPVAVLSPASRARVRLGRALALDPRIVLAEHPTASLDAGAAAQFAADLSRTLEQRGVAALVLTADRGVAERISKHALVLNAATGELKRRPRWSLFS
jgi:ABC-type transporter Mla maintaining outer membrane lipid asymmetry ATPase subunit MlaF